MEMINTIMSTRRARASIGMIFGLFILIGCFGCTKTSVFKPISGWGDKDGLSNFYFAKKDLIKNSVEVILQAELTGKVMAESNDEVNPLTGFEEVEYTITLYNPTERRVDLRMDSILYIHEDHSSVLFSDPTYLKLVPLTVQPYDLTEQYIIPDAPYVDLTFRFAWNDRIMTKTIRLERLTTQDAKEKIR